MELSFTNIRKILGRAGLGMETWSNFVHVRFEISIKCQVERLKKTLAYRTVELGEGSGLEI